MAERGAECGGRTTPCRVGNVALRERQTLRAVRAGPRWVAVEERRESLMEGLKSRLPTQRGQDRMAEVRHRELVQCSESATEELARSAASGSAAVAANLD